MYIPNASIQTRIKDEKYMAIINIRGALVYIQMEIAPYVYGPYDIIYCKGVKKPIAKCQNEIYGTMKANLLYYKKYRNIIED